jgi:hypothetical protein
MSYSVGDYVTINSSSTIFRVSEADENGCLLEPIYRSFSSIQTAWRYEDNERIQKKLTLLDVGHEFLRFQEFIEKFKRSLSLSGDQDGNS